MEELRPNEQRARNAITLIRIVLVLEIIAFISGYFQYNLLKGVADGGEVSTETANANDTREQIVAILYMVAMIVSAVTFIQWFRRAYYNLHLKVSYLNYSEGWAAGSWFVPILSLFRPFQIMKELYQETQVLLARKGLEYNHQLSTNTLGIWWALWVVNNILSQFAFRTNMKADTIDDYITGTLAGMAGNLIGIPLAFLAIKVISDYAVVEPLLKEVQNEETMATI